MSKKSIVLIGVLLLVFIVFFILNKESVSTLNKDESTFSISNTGNISKIFITNKANKEYVIIEKKNGIWYVNNNYKADLSQIDIVMQTLRKIEVKKPVAKESLESVKKNLSINGTKVEIYENGSLSRVFYVGGNTPDEMGTYFYNENANEPYICHIPGFNGYLSTRFFTNLNAWRSKMVFETNVNDIASIDVKWIDNPANSFYIDNTGEAPTISHMNKTYINNQQINANILRTYLGYWSSLGFEGFPINLTPAMIDSIAHTKPLLILTLNDKKKNTTTLTIHPKGIQHNSRMKYDTKGNPLNYEIDNFYAFINNNKTEVVQIQDFVFGKVMKTFDNFLLK